jgi:hypothetical protein
MGRQHGNRAGVAAFCAAVGGSLLIAAAVWIGMDTPPNWVGWSAGGLGLSVCLLGGLRLR